jgi:UDP-N-acetylmuramyl pentapeptide synthase
MEVLQMQNAMCANTIPLEDEFPDEELIDTLIAISVVSKRLAEKLRKQNKKTRSESHE